MSKKLTKEELLECIDFFNKLTVTEEDVTTDQQRANGQLVVKATYQYEGKCYTTPMLYYKDIFKQNHVNNPSRISKYFEEIVYWLDRDFHDWPKGKGFKIEDRINEYMADGNQNFRSLLDDIADDDKNGYLQRLAQDGESQMYGYNLVNNNHWHDLIGLVKCIIKNQGSEVDKKYFNRLVFKWKAGNRDSLHLHFGDRKIISKLHKNIKSVQMELDIKKYSALLKHKHQIILQGPPGTGKTYTAKDIAEDMIFDGNVSDDKKAQQKKLEESGGYKLIQFHPAYTYEDFVRGITVEANGNNVNYKAENRVLGAFAEEAAANSDKNYVLVIDEINRANLPAVLGELIYALEYRGHAVESMYKVDGGDNKLLLPENLYIIGTMNTADRSVGHIDYAIRRRFAFKSILPDKELVHDKAKELFENISKLFIANYSNNSPKTEKPESSSHMAQDFAPEDVWLGHSYFMVKKTNENGEPIDEAEALRRLDLKLQYEIKPLLREYVKDGILLEKSELMKPEGKGKWTVKEYIEDLQVS